MIDTDKYEGHTKEKWCARNVGDGSPMSCDKDYDHDHPFIETQTDTFENPAIGYFGGGREAHSLEERRANMKLIADAPLLLEEVKRLHIEVKALRKNQGYEMKFPVTALVIDELLIESRQLRKKNRQLQAMLKNMGVSE